MKKLALLLALLMIVGCFAACGGDSETNGTTDPAAVGGNAAGENGDGTGGEIDLEECPSSDEGKHQYTEEIAGEPSCQLPGLMLYTCAACGYSTSQEIAPLGHQGTGASCEEPSICSVCGEVAEEAWGHESENGICKNCGIALVEAEANGATASQEPTTEATTPATTA